ncbi:twin-arginine translocase subunit TatC [Brachybacterium sp. EF45031]|nr:twin-arginine translocase subunit TatC [Brachybacterium sillae]
MSLGEHLVELRNRMLICALSVLLMSIVGWVFYDQIFAFIDQPFQRARADGVTAYINLGTVGSPLDVQLRVSAYVGLILAAPIILYQAWAFIMPGLHKHERRYALGFFFPAVFLFIVGLLAGYWVMDKAVPLLLGFAPDGQTVQNIDINKYLQLFVKTMLAFGIAFVMPVVLVLLNFLGLITGRSMLKAWRWVVFVCFLFTAIMVPTPDPFTMIFMTIPMVALYFIAVGISIWNDRRRGIREGEDLDDDEASVIDDAPEAIDAPERLDSLRGDALDRDLRDRAEER